MFVIVLRGVICCAVYSDSAGEDLNGIPYNESQTMNPVLAANFCAWCLDLSSSIGVGGCRSEFYTDENLKKCGIDIGKHNSTARK